MYYYGKFYKERIGSVLDWVVCLLYTGSIFLIPFFMVAFYLYRFKDWQNEEFDAKFGAPLDGLKKERKSSLIFPVYFVIRRVSFALVSITLFNHVILQLAIHWAMSTFAFGYLATFMPYEDSLTCRLDIFNEMVTILVIDICFIFTPLDPDAQRQYRFGYVFIAVVVLCIGTHVYFLLRDPINQLKNQLI